MFGVFGCISMTLGCFVAKCQWHLEVVAAWCCFSLPDVSVKQISNVCNCLIEQQQQPAKLFISPLNSVNTYCVKHLIKAIIVLIPSAFLPAEFPLMKQVLMKDCIYSIIFQVI